MKQKALSPKDLKSDLRIFRSLSLEDWKFVINVGVPETVKVILGQVTHCFRDGENSDELREIPGGDIFQHYCCCSGIYIDCLVVPQGRVVPGTNHTRHYRL